MSTLRYDVHVSAMTALSPSALSLPGGAQAHWSPLAHTLIHGPTEAVLVDPPITLAQSAQLGDWIEDRIGASGKRLSTIYLTHGHADHWLGTAPLLERFPGVTVRATRATVDVIRATAPDGVATGIWPAAFPGQLADARFEVEPVAGDGFRIDGHALLPVEVGHSDIDASTVLHVPSIGLVVAGDVVYNNVHQYLGESADGGLEAWRKALEVVQSLDPVDVVAGHQDPSRGNRPSDIAATRAYLDTAEELLAAQPGREEFLTQLVRLYPERINPFTVWMSALRLLPGKAA
ncbi:MBL fold metallo-hydrolase [Streptacidiphilus sp. N1-3]|uniref:MBL fold metallo-hydrolase n=1 Tax=Streptacidiphilus alkalitolerans TaxID=3342712 RepID=A0ABV6XDI7_9ACTN